MEHPVAAPNPRDEPMIPTRITLLGLALTLLTACAPDAPETELRPTRGILLVSLDTLRADHLGAYGYERDTSPFLDSMARRGVLFENAIAQYPSTLTSHMSLFTGLYPGEHAVYPPDAILSDEIPTLPELLQAAGYRTGGFTEGAFVDGRFGFARGFDVFNDEAERRFDDIERTLARAHDFLGSLQPEQRFFLFVHTYTIHDPYDPPASYAARFWPGDPPDTFPPDAPHLVRYNAHGGPLPPGTAEYFTALYDASIRYADDRLREFFGFLREQGLASDLTVVVLSDHGEQFLEHGQFVHADIYQETMRVPLLVLHPDLPAPWRVSHPVELVDVMPTLLALADARPAATVSGTSLVGDLVGDAPGRRETGYGEVDEGGDRTYFATDGDRLLNLVVHRWSPEEWVGREIRFDVPNEAAELRLTSYRQPRTTLLLEGARQLRTVSVPPHPASLTLDLSSLGIAPGSRLTARTDECIEPREGSSACWALRVLSPRAVRTELFELGSDPLALDDVAARHPETSRRLLRELLTLHHAPRATPLIERLEGELENRLRALGYL